MVNEKKEHLRNLISSMIEGAGSGHYASSMSALEIMYPLFYEDKIKPEQFILSKGHAVPALYAILYDLGYLKKEDLDNFRQYGGLPGHPSIGIPGVLVSSGSLGMGLSKAVGLAYANPETTYHVLLGDGELQEGQNWEALFYLESTKIENIIIHIDCNRQQYSNSIRSEKEFWLFDEINESVILHFTKWEHDNKWLTQSNPAMKKYQDRILDYSSKIYNLMEINPNVIVLNADLEQDFCLTKIKEKYPDRYVQCGISEQHMVSMAGGLARASKQPICHTFGAFYRRALDQIYNNCCDGLSVVYTAGLCGKHPINIGMSHYDYSDVFYRCLPGLFIINDPNIMINNLGKNSVYLKLNIPNE